MSKPILLIDSFCAGFDTNGNGRYILRLTAVMPKRGGYQRQYYFAGTEDQARLSLSEFTAHEYPHAAECFQQGKTFITGREYQGLKRMAADQARAHARFPQPRVVA